MKQRSRDRNELIVSYLFLRQVVGWIGTLLPVVLLVGNAISSTAPRPDSMSGYYYTDMRNIFVGTLCALGVFLVAYRGYDDVDESITNVAGLAAIGVAFFPTKPAVTRLSTSQQVVGDIHLVFAATALIGLGLMALRFAKQGHEKTGGSSQPNSAAENAIYRASGGTILACVVLAVLSNLLPASVKANWPLLFIFEAVAVFAFGVSWFVKGRTIQGIRARIKKARQRGAAPGTGGSPVPGPAEQTVTV
jgi:hypothetical protein